jgi:hypothetical protein
MKGAHARTVRRLAWFVALWLASVAALGLVAYAMRTALGL